jgi:type IV secretory pathway ATPase VirB11/archaellum biosynthesis ATPase
MLGIGKRSRSRRPPGQEAILTPEPPAPLPLVDSYRLGLYDVQIGRRDGRNVYSASLTGEASSFTGDASFALGELIRDGWTPPSRPSSLGDLLYQVSACSAPLLARRAGSYALPLAMLVAYQFVGLPSLQPFFEDDSVDELYIDSPRSAIYLDHRRHGRCGTAVYLSKREIVALQTHLEMFCGESPSLEHPTVKGELQAGGMRLRIGMDVPPLALNGASVHIRKVGAKPFTLPLLVRDGTVGAGEAAFLAACLLAPVNVTIVGPSGSGKTSLLNALDAAAPPEFRRIYVEDAVESLDLAPYGFHQSKLRVPPIESEAEGGGRKTLEVLKSLHKTPDLLILGEIQSESHSRALFQSLSAGIKGLQTYHASGPEQALRRWTQLHGIAPVQLADLGVIATMTRPDPLSSKRYLTRISQVDAGTGKVEDIFTLPHPYTEHVQRMEPTATKAAFDSDAVRGDGWFGVVLEECRRRLGRALDLGATDLGGFLSVYWEGRSPDAPG